MKKTIIVVMLSCILSGLFVSCASKNVSPVESAETGSTTIETGKNSK